MKKINWLQIIVTAVMTLIVGIISTIIAVKLQVQEPRLIYSITETTKIKMKDQDVAIYKLSVENNGKKFVENIDCQIRISSANIEEVSINKDPTIKYTSSVVDDTVVLNFPLLNPSEEVQVSILANASINLPERPEIKIRGKGVIGIDKSIEKSRVKISNIVFGLLIGVLTGVFTWLIWTYIKRKSTLFYDNFKSFKGWQKYKEGEVSLSNEIVPKRGKYCLKKELHHDRVGGGFKNLRKSIGLGIVFSGWIYRPSNSSSTSLGDRLAIEDKNNNGYGFSVDHRLEAIWIERRDKGIHAVISKQESYSPPKDKWYQFIFYIRPEGKFNLEIHDGSGEGSKKVSSDYDISYKKFDRVVVHGGFPYYVDDLKVVKLKI